MTIPYTFAGRTSPIDVAEIDANFTALDGRANNPNLIINPVMEVAQRYGISNPLNLTNTPQYSLDRWAAVQNSGTPLSTVMQATVTGALTTFPRRSLVLTRPSGNGTGGISLLQALETPDSVVAAGQKITLSFYASVGAGFSGNPFVVKVYSGRGTDQSVSNLYNGLWTGQATVINTTQTIATAWTRYSFTSSAVVPVDTTQLGVYFTFNPTGTAGVNDYIAITGVKLEVGEYATALNPLSFGEELARCQRYYVKSFPYATVPASAAGTNGSVGWNALGAGIGHKTYVGFPTQMRTTPTFTFYNPLAAGSQARNSFVPADYTGTAASAQCDRGFQVFATAPGGTVLGQDGLVHFTADAEL